jgi:hypothetical protein
MIHRQREAGRALNAEREASFTFAARPTQPVGNPSTRCAMMLRWISDVPPAMVPAKLRA